MFAAFLCEEVHSEVTVSAVARERSQGGQCFSSTVELLFERNSDVTDTTTEVAGHPISSVSLASSVIGHFSKTVAYKGQILITSLLSNRHCNSKCNTAGCLLQFIYCGSKEKWWTHALTIWCSFQEVDCSAVKQSPHVCAVGIHLCHVGSKPCAMRLLQCLFQLQQCDRIKVRVEQNRKTCYLAYKRPPPVCKTQKLLPGMPLS